MTTESNYDYYSENDTLNVHIDNVILLKKFMDELLEDIKKGDYDIPIIQKLSGLTDTFFTDIEDKKENKLTPRFKIVNDSDSSESCSDGEYESDDSTKATNGYKLSHFGIKSKKSKLDRVNFIDDDTETSGHTNYLLKYSTPINYGTRTPPNTPKKNLYDDYYKSHFSYGKTSDYIKSKVSDEEYDRLDTLYKLTTDGDSKDPETEVETKEPENKPSEETQVVITKPKDKLADEFLSNSLELTNFNYSKYFDNSRINNYINLCYIY